MKSFKTLKANLDEAKKPEYSNPQVQKEYEALKKSSKSQLAAIYQRSHRVSDETELKRMSKAHIISDILVARFGRKRIEE